MIRLTALWLFVAALAIYSRRDWYVSLCGLILLMAVIEHPDMPKTMLGIQGLNPWNLLLVIVVAGWWSARKREGLTWDMPSGTTTLLLIYGGVVIVSFSRMFVDRSAVDDWSTPALVSEYLVNSLKWVVPGLLLFDGCRSRRRFYMAVGSVLGVYVFLGLYVIKWMPLGLLSSGDELQKRALKILVNEIGYHRVNISMMLAAASWAIFASRSLLPGWRRQALVFLSAGAVLYAQALTGGRMGYVTWAAVGLVLCSIRNRGLLLAGPVMAAIVLLTVPAAGERLLQGFDPGTSDYQRDGDPYEQGGPDAATITSGRTIIWPYVIARIGESPLVGYGRLAMRRTGLESFLATDLNEGFSHPHNAYLEVLLDNGALGFVAIMPFYALILVRAFSLYADSRSPMFVAAGGICAAFVLALLVAAMGSQTFYPREGAVGMWCSIGLMMRVWVQRQQLAGSRPASRVATGPPPVRWPAARTGGTPAAPPPATAAPAARAALPPASIDERLWSAA